MLFQFSGVRCLGFLKLFLIFLGFVAPLEVKADQYAVILSTMASEESETKTLLEYVNITSELLNKASFQKENILCFVDGGPKVRPNSLESTQEIILKEIAQFSQRIKKEDDLWVFIFGHANVTSRGLSISTRGPRLLGEQLAESLNQITAKQFVFCLNRQSTAFMPLLQKKDRIVVTATNALDQLNPPLFTKYFLNIWNSDPSQTILPLLRIAAEQTKSYYREYQLAFAEESQVYDGNTLRSAPLNEIDPDPLAKISLKRSLP